jgi:putative aldouronate transport system substrate-binding protein
MPNRTEILYTDDIRNRLVTLDGKMYGLPQPGALPRTDALVIRKDWLDKLGLEMPKTLEDFLAVAKAFTEQDPDGNGKKDTYGFCGYIESEQMGVLSGLGKRFEWVFGAYGVNGAWNLSDANFGLNARNPNYMKAVDYIRQLNEAGVIDPDWPTLKKDEFRARWKQGSCGIMNENFAALSTKANYADFDKNFPDGEWVVLPPPTGPDGKSSQGVDVRNVRIFAMSQKAKEAGKAEAIAKLLEWMSGDEGYYLLGFGQEGINYKKDDKGFVTTKGIEPPENAYTHKSQQPLTQLRNMVFNNNEIELNARYVPYKTAKERDMNPLAYFKAYGEQPWTEATGWMVINPPPGGADFTRFYSENLVKFALGQQPINEQTWTEFVNGLDGLGAKDYEVQAKETLQNSGFLP